MCPVYNVVSSSRFPSVAVHCLGSKCPTLDYIVPYFFLLGLNYRFVKEWNFITRTNIFSKRGMNVNVNVIRSVDSLGSGFVERFETNWFPSLWQVESVFSCEYWIEIGGTLFRNILQNILQPTHGGVRCPVSSVYVLTLLVLHCEVDWEDLLYINNLPVLTCGTERFSGVVKIFYLLVVSVILFIVDNLAVS